MTTDPNRLLVALANTTRKVSFKCPRTELNLVVRLPSRALCAAAREAAQQAWGSREIKTSVDLEEYASCQSEQLIARSVFVEDAEEPIGLETVHALDEATLRHYNAHVQGLMEAADPPLETWTQEQVEGLVDAIKKKDAEIEVRLRSFGETRLIGLVLCLGALLANSETSNSSTNTSGKSRNRKRRRRRP